MRRHSGYIHTNSIPGIFQEGPQKLFPVGVNIVGETMRKLPATATNWILATLALEMHQSERIHPVGMPDRLQILLTHITYQ